ncbi:hypothetical protein FMEXI_2305 [Fusarium mexicanum]|uniref:Uncharacterized protein n=1 Tax=Fusarium mexicanum TaxID=751941 RepID=A0A8H5N4V1_9HYPO|nr:hypothetical protein FMEXI_2305 [Fusarium mexicanum]
MKSWFLAPDFTFTPDGPLQLGAVIPHPSRPTQTLASPRTDAITLPEVQTLVETNHSHSNDDTRTAGVNLFAKFVELASASIGYEISPAGTVPVEVGGGISGGKESSKTDSYETAPGIIFAYRLHAIRVRGSGGVSSEMFSHRKLFMSDRPESEPFEVVDVTEEVLKADRKEEDDAPKYEMEELGDEEYCFLAEA